MATFPNTTGADLVSTLGNLQWDVLDIADSTGSRDPSSILNGSVTMGGTDNEYLQIPVTGVLTDDSAADCAWLYFAMPALTNDQATVILEIDGTYRNGFGVGGGFIDTTASLGGIAVVHQESGLVGALAADWSLTSITNRDATQADPDRLVVSISGPLDGVGSTSVIVSSVVSGASKGRATTRVTNGLFTSSTNFGVAITRRGTTSAGTMSLRIRRAVLPYA